MYLYLYTKNILALFRLVYLYCILVYIGYLRQVYLDIYICFIFVFRGWSLVLIGLAEAMVFAWVYCEYWQLPIIGVFNAGFLT